MTSRESEIEIVRAFSELHAAKLDAGGVLERDEDRRYASLKRVCHELFVARGVENVPKADRFERREIAARLPHRDRLRIPVELSGFFCFDGGLAPAESRNLGAGGVCVRSPLSPSPGAPVTLYLPNLGGGYERLFETSLRVVWRSEARGAQSGIGLQFADLDEASRLQLDGYVLRLLRARLSRTGTVPVAD